MGGETCLADGFGSELLLLSVAVVVVVSVAVAGVWGAELGWQWDEEVTCFCEEGSWVWWAGRWGVGKKMFCNAQERKLHCIKTFLKQ